MKQNHNGRTQYLGMIASMLIFGTIGIFVKGIALPSPAIAFARGVTGAIFLVLVMLTRKKKPDFAALRRSLVTLCLSGAALGCNWILLFEAYRYTSVSVATLCYYMAPVIIVLVSPIFLGERLTARKLICAPVAIIGMLGVSGVIGGSGIGQSDIKGVLLGLGAAVLYATVVLLNKRLKGLNAYDRTVSQLGISSLVILPYILLTGGFAGAKLTPISWVLLIAVGIIHTGLAYALYFGSIGGVKAQTAAMLSYIDPVTAIILSFLVLGERMDLWMALGAGLVLAAAALSEMPERR